MPKKHKIVFYNPNALFYTMPLAFLATASALDSDRYIIRFVDGRLEDDPVGRVLSECEDALCLGVSVITGAPVRDALRISRAVKASRPDLPVIWGGWHPSIFPADTLEEKSIDIAVYGQGEATMRDLADRLAEGSSLEGLQGVAIRSAEGVRVNPPRDVTDINEFPSLDFQLIPVEKYFSLKGKRQLDYVASTGCFYRCAFCVDSLVYHRRWVGLTPERIGREIGDLWKRYGFHDLVFQDEDFFSYRNRVAEIAEEFLRRNLRFTWTATMRADQGSRLSQEVFALSARSGLRKLLIGVESGSQEMLDWIVKDITVEQVLDCAEKCKRYNIGATFPFIVGFPGETDTSVRETMALAKTLRRMSPGFEIPVFYFMPYPGSVLLEKILPEEYSLPASLEEWAEFDYIGTSGPWVTGKKYKTMERFKFYNHLSGLEPKSFVHKILRRIGLWRSERDFYSFPLEKILIELIRPPKKLS